MKVIIGIGMYWCKYKRVSFRTYDKLFIFTVTLKKRVQKILSYLL